MERKFKIFLTLIVLILLAYLVVQNYYNSLCWDYQGDVALLTVRGVYCRGDTAAYSVYKPLRDFMRPKSSGGNGL